MYRPVRLWIDQEVEAGLQAQKAILDEEENRIKDEDYADVKLHRAGLITQRRQSLALRHHIEVNLKSYY